MEEFKYISDTDQKYKISKSGKVFEIDKNKILVEQS